VSPERESSPRGDVEGSGDPAPVVSGFIVGGCSEVEDAGIELSVDGTVDVTPLVDPVAEYACDGSYTCPQNACRGS
jgi:hypothetical protein